MALINFSIGVNSKNKNALSYSPTSLNALDNKNQATNNLINETRKKDLSLNERVLSLKNKISLRSSKNPCAKQI